MSDSPVIFVDGVSSAGSHNQVDRVVLYRLNAEGKPVVVAELLLSRAGMEALKTTIANLGRR